MLGRDFRQILDECQIPQSERYIIHALEHGTVTVAKDKSVSYNGRISQQVVDATPIYDKHQRIIAAILILRDVGHEREAAHRMQHLETLAAVGQLAAGAVHEIRNPLTAIKGFAKLVYTRAMQLDQATLANYCTVIDKEIDHLNEILTEFLALARPCSANFATVDLVKITQDVIAFLFGDALLGGISVVPNLPDQPVYVYGCSDKLKEVLVNLFRNAFQAMAPGGTLTITLDQTDHHVLLSVKDTGIGMTSAVMANIFKPFFTTKESGTGLGLSICQYKIHEHNGTIEVTSTPGVGSIFTITLPRQLLNEGD